MRQADDEQADGAAAEHDDAARQSQTTQIDRVQRHTQRLQQGRVGIAERVWHREAAMRRHEHAFTKRAIVRPQPAEVQTATKVGVAGEAELAALTRLGGINRHALTRAQRLVFPVTRVRATGQHLTTKFMAEDQRVLHHRVTDASVFIAVQVRTADTDRRDLNEGLAGPGSSRFIHLVNADVTRIVQSGCQHVPLPGVSATYVLTFFAKMAQAFPAVTEGDDAGRAIVELQGAAAQVGAAGRRAMM